MWFRLFAIALSIGSLSHRAPAYDREPFLNFVLFQLPAEYFLGIPPEERGTIFRDASSSPKEGPLSYKGCYLFYEVREKAQIWIKLLPRDLDRKIQNPYPPLVYIHTAEVVTTGPDSEELSTHYETRILRWSSPGGKNTWTDVTDKHFPEGFDRSLPLRPHRKHFFIEIGNPKTPDPYQPLSRILAWENWKFHLRRSYPYYSSYSWDAPFDPARLTHLVSQQLQGRGEERELAQAIVHAGLVKNETFRFLLEIEEFKQVPLLSYALASYEYALDRNEEAIDFIIGEVAREGNGDTNSKWMLHYFDEWDRTLEIYREYDGTDGAAAEASVMFVEDRRYFFPENFEKFWAKKMEEIDGRP